MPMLTMFRIGLPVWPFQSPGAHPVGEVGHPVEDLVDLGDDVDAVDDQRRALGHAQRDVQDRAVLGDVDRLAPEHHVPALARARTPRPAGPAARIVSSVMRFFE